MMIVLEHYQRMYEIYCNYSIFLPRPLRVDKMNSYRRYPMAFATTYYILDSNESKSIKIMSLISAEEIRYGAIFNGFDLCLFSMLEDLASFQTQQI